jgi:hypothetical protein
MSSCPTPSFRLLDLPVEVAILILLCAATSSLSTYRSLALVSRGTKDMAYLECIPEIPIVLNTLFHVQSFYDFVTANSAVALQVRYLWIGTLVTPVSPDILFRAKAGVTDFLLAIIESCRNITKFACRPDVLKMLARESRAPILMTCKDLTLIENWDAWEEHISSPSVSQIFSRITHLRVQGRMTFDIPKSLFNSLTHLSFQSDSGSLKSLIDIDELQIGDMERYPTLRQVVLTMWSYEDIDTFMSQAYTADSRICIFRRPSEWREIDIWQDPVQRKRSIWERAMIQQDTWRERTRRRVA